MEKSTTRINCPKCGTPIDVNDILYHQLEDEIQKRFNARLSEEREKYLEQEAILRKQRAELTSERMNLEEKISEAVRQRLKADREALEKELRQKIESDEAERFKVMQLELDEKSEKLREFNRAKAEIEKLKREKEELSESVQAEMQRTLTEQLQEEKVKIQRMEQEKSELAIRELQKRLDDQVRLTEEMRRKQEQGSMQLQGEAQELAIEEWLKSAFPFDTITEIRKGVLGGDCIQVVNTPGRTNCGSIYYESKRTKSFGGDWIAKFKADMRSKGIPAGILVTQAYPKGLERMGLVDGIWVCNFEEFKGLSAVIRESVIRINEASASQENRGDKMALLYNFLTSPEFKAQVEAIVEGFTQMKQDLEAEKNAMRRLWSTREKQIEKVVSSTVAMYGAVRGIAGNAIGTVQALELGPAGTDEGDSGNGAN